MIPSYKVTCDASNNSPESIAKGLLNVGIEIDVEAAIAVTKPLAIRFLREYYKSRIRAAQQALITLAETCPHEGAVKSAHSDTGNWDRGQDRYWYAHYCEDCGKTWEAAQ